MDIIVISTLNRLELFAQTLSSLSQNAAMPETHNVVIVLDGPKLEIPRLTGPLQVVITGAEPVGASRSRNIGAGSIPRYRRQEHVMFVDDDIYAAPSYDTQIERLMKSLPFNICSGGSHPYNHGEPRGDYSIPLVISSVCMAMKWNIFDECGPWTEPGGAGASEDYAMCMKAKSLGYGFAVTSPELILHCGLTSSTGKEIVGADLVRERNAELEALHGISGKVLYA